MAEVEFEDNCAEIKEYLQTVRECKQNITQIPAVLKKLLDLLNTSTVLLEDLCTFDDAPDTLQRQCVRSRQQMISFYEGSALRSLTDSIQGVVHQRLMRMEQIALQSYGECKRRREARAKYLSDMNSKRPFNLAAPSAETVQRHKEGYTERDETYRRACEEFAQYRYEEMGTAQRDFYSGYSGVFALLTNALNLPTADAADAVDGDAAASTTTRNRMRRQPRHSSSLRARRREQQTSSTTSGGKAPAAAAAATEDQKDGRDGGGRRRNTAPASPLSPTAAAATKASQGSQRRLSDGCATEKPPAAAAADDDDACCRRTASMRSGEVVRGIPVEEGHRDYGEGTHTYTSQPRSATSPDGGSKRSGSEDGSRGERATARKSSSATLNHFNCVSPDTASLHRDYSMFDYFGDD